ncbi:MAG: immune inhibitor A [Chloroflexota bacterium]|nr:immune inhibitor A [Chloroflexota bacterium]
MNNKSAALPIIITILLLLALCCLGICLVLIFSGNVLMTRLDTAAVEVAQPSPVVVTEDTNPIISTPMPTPKPGAVLAAIESLDTLQQELVPINNPIDLAERLGGKQNIPEILFDENAPYALGDSQEFWVTDVDTNENFKVNTILRYLGDHVYFWIEEGVDYDQEDLNALGDTFDKEIYPTNREFFGGEWYPGVDGDPRIYIVYAGGLGNSLAGYFSSADSLHPEAHAFSNAHEMFLINSDNVALWEDYIYGTLAHEYQHMIHWYRDKNEETWLNEGFSMLAELINGFDPGGFDYSYINNPDLQLTDWGTDVGRNGPHYGASLLFTTYFLDRFGDEATQAVVAHDENGMESIDIVLDEMGIRDPITGEQITAEDVFADWAVTNILGDCDAADGRYCYYLYPSAPVANPGITFPSCPISQTNYDVAQFGVDYVEITCPGQYTLSFSGNTTNTILPTTAYSGDYFFWSNMGDHSNMSLEQRFDLTGVSTPIEMTYQTWYDLEEDYDYVFVSATTDETDWQILNTTSCTYENPSGNSYGCGLNGQTNGWQLETVDLSQFAGEEVTIRFDYVTDAAVNGVGMVIDDVEIAAIEYFSDFEADQGGWDAKGFVRIQNLLPQTFRISMITLGNEIEIVPVELDAANQAKIEIEINNDVDSVILVISGTTPVTRQKAQYSIEID